MTEQPGMLTAERLAELRSHHFYMSGLNDNQAREVFAHIDAITAELDEEQAALEGMEMLFADGVSALTSARKTIARLRAALEFYASSQPWFMPESKVSLAERDYGNRARDELAALDGGATP